MAEGLPVLSAEPPPAFERDRLAEFLRVLELMAAGETDERLKISARHDELDAIAHGVNVLVSELGWATDRVLRAQEERAAAAEQANASKSVFLRNLSHEIRTPVSAMLGFADLLASADVAQYERFELLRLLKANGQAVLSLLGDLLDLAKLDASKVVLSPEPVSVIELVREVLSSLEIDSRPKGLHLHVDAMDDALGSIVTDRQRLRQIFVNVLSNAVKFTDAGSIEVSLGVSFGIEGEQWTIDITDTGIGIAPEHHAALFEPFGQANASISRTYGGSGLGLALSRRLAELLGGGLVLLRSAPGVGTAFRLTMKPLPAPASEPDVDRAQNDDDESGDVFDDVIRGRRILLAEDHRDLHIALRKFLEHAGATVESAYDGREAVAIAALAPFDVVLMDLKMPHLDGFEATRTLRDQGCGVPIIALTADLATVFKEAAMDAGCDACLSKPFTLEALSGSIRRSPRHRA